MLIREGLRARKGRAIAGDGRLTDALQLPFGLTGAQLRVGREIAGDMAQDRPMLRMLQGDVGSGKTLVALRAMLAAVEAGRSEEHTSELQSLMRISYAVFCLKQKKL